MTDAALDRSRFILHPLALAALAVVNGAVWAQTTPPEPAPAPAATGQATTGQAATGQAASGQAAAGQAAAGTSQTVVITANRRKEMAKDVAGSVSVLNGGQLDRLGATSIEELAGYIPGLQVNGDSPGNQKLSIRGITTGSKMIGATVATYLDEQPVSLSNSIIGGSSINNDVDPLDLDRIEVLKGPQGSLYGASALGGLVKYVTVLPNLKETEGRVELGYSTRRGNGGMLARAAVSVPIAKDLLAVRVTAYTRTEPGYVEDTLRGKKDVGEYRNEGARFSALLKPSSAFDAKLVLDTQTLKSDDMGTPQYDPVTLQPRFGNYGAQRATAGPVKNGYDRGALTLNYDLGFASLLSVTSYARIKNDLRADTSDYGRFLDFVTAAALAQAGFPVVPFMPASAQSHATIDTKKKVQEFRLTSPSEGLFQWLGGVFFQEETNFSRASLDFFGPSVPFLDGVIHTKLREKAAYANATYKLTDTFDVQAGLRYSSISQDYSVDASLFNYVVGAPVAIPANAANTREHQTTWMLSPRWAFSRDDMVYFRAASGYRPGGPNVPDAFGGVHAPLKSDSIVNYELGYKGVFPAAQADVSVALFRIDWKDIQLTATDPTSANTYYTNGGKARSQGLELEAGWRPARGLRLAGSMSFQEAKLTEDVAAVGGKSGDDVPFTPKFSAALSADYSFALGAGQLSVGSSVRHVGKRSVTFSSEPANALVPTNPSPTLPAYELLDLRTAYSWDRWTASLFVKNALNKRAPVNYTGNYVVMNFVTGAVSPADVAVTPPRTIGVSLRADF